MNKSINDYLKHIRPRIAATTYRRKAWMVQAFDSYLAKSKLSLVTAKRVDVESFLLLHGSSSQYRQATCCTIRELYDYVKYPENPAANIIFKPDHSRKLPVVPSQVAIAEIISRLSDNTSNLHIRDRLMIELAYGSGLRRNELHRLNIEDVDLESGTANVTGKGDKCRKVPLTAQTTSAIREYLLNRPATRGPLFVSYASRRLSCMGIYAAIRTRASLHPHQLRHACATHMLANGCGIRAIGELLGHADLASTQIYTAIEKGDLARIVNEKHPRKSTP